MCLYVFVFQGGGGEEEEEEEEDEEEEELCFYRALIPFFWACICSV